MTVLEIAMIAQRRVDVEENAILARFASEVQRALSCVVTEFCAAYEEAQDEAAIAAAAYEIVGERAGAYAAGIVRAPAGEEPDL